MDAGSAKYFVWASCNFLATIRCVICALRKIEKILGIDKPDARSFPEVSQSPTRRFHCLYNAHIDLYVSKPTKTRRPPILADV